MQRLDTMAVRVSRANDLAIRGFRILNSLELEVEDLNG